MSLVGCDTTRVFLFDVLRYDKRQEEAKTSSMRNAMVCTSWRREVYILQSASALFVKSGFFSMSEDCARCVSNMIAKSLLCGRS